MKRILSIPNSDAVRMIEAIDMAISALQGGDAQMNETKSPFMQHTPSTDGDLISRADAMGEVQDHFNANGFKGYDDGQKMMDRIKALPSADTVSREAHYDAVANRITDMEERGFVAVVRCKDCRHYEDGMIGYCGELERGVSEDFYCYYGERGEK